MKKIVFLSGKYFDFKNNCLTIGGVQTYLTDLMSVGKTLEIPMEFYQMGDYEADGLVMGIPIHQIKVLPQNKQEFSNLVYKRVKQYDVVAFYSTDAIVPQKMPFDYAIGIQHGISWDIPCTVKRHWLRSLLSRIIRNHNIERQAENLDLMVCVDYNYINWLRTNVDKITTKLIAIPNYTRIAPPCEKPKEVINVIFARRLYEYRGTRVFAAAAERILREYKNVTVTVAGTGPDEQYMRDRLSGFTNVTFLTYESSDSLRIHADKHIAVVPTVGSEGTSLSLLEAMSAQCAVIASNVGGMTNIVLDGYNGLVVNAGDVDSLYAAIKRLLDNPMEIKQIAEKGYETVKSAFSYEKWMGKWTTVLTSIVN